jgi:NADH:ubiquinone oxidoreductase subunit F (NADH-binding)
MALRDALLHRVLDADPCADLAAWVERGGRRGLQIAGQLGSAGIVDEVEAAGLRGRGGAGFPTGRKWRSVVAESSPQKPPPVVVNAAEGEPATFKDRELLRRNPYKVLEGALIAAHAVGAPEVVVGIKASFEREIARLGAAVAEMTDAGWTNGLRVRVVPGPGEYLFGEETALLEVIEGRQPFPRVTPPYRRGLDEPPDAGNAASGVELAAGGTTAAAPVVVDNVETLANLPGILAHGADWFRGTGTTESPGTLVCTVSGHTRRHGVGEVPMGTPLRTVLELLGEGPASGGRIIGALSGVANPIVPEDLLDTPLSYEAMAAIGSGLGAGGFFVLDDRTDPVAVAYAAARFLAVESCGQCEPCKRDGLAIARTLAAWREPPERPPDLEGLQARLSTITDGARCFLASQQERVVGSLLAAFPDAFASSDGRTAIPEHVLPIVDIVDDRAVLDLSHLDKQPDWSHDEADSGEWPAAARGDAPVEISPPVVPEANPSRADTTGARPAGRDPLQPLLDLHREVGEALYQTMSTGGDATPESLGELRRRLHLHADLNRRVVGPLARRLGGPWFDDVTWVEERDEAEAGDLLDAFDAASARPSAEAWATLANRIRATLDEDRTLVAALRSHLDADALQQLGDAVQDARATSLGPS